MCKYERWRCAWHNAVRYHIKCALESCNKVYLRELIEPGTLIVSQARHFTQRMRGYSRVWWPVLYQKQDSCVTNEIALSGVHTWQVILAKDVESLLPGCMRSAALAVAGVWMSGQVNSMQAFWGRAHFGPWISLILFEAHARVWPCRETSTNSRVL
jgi:hypothetical protein